MPSVQLQRYLEERAAGGSVTDACFVSGIDAVEAELHESDIASGTLELPQSTKERTMPKHDQVEEVFEPDFALMKRIFDHDIKPASEGNAKSRGDLSQAWGEIEKTAHCNKRAAKLLFKLRNESEETRDDFLRTLYGGMKALGISADLVDRMNDSDAPTMPTVESRGLGTENLATVQ